MKIHKSAEDYLEMILMLKEEKNSADQITKMELFGSDPRSLYMLNGELAARVYSAPSLVL